MEELSSHDKKKLKKLEKHHIPVKEKSKKFPVLQVVGILLVSFLIIVVFMSGGASYDNFAKCLSGKGVVVYGNEWCTYTASQKSDFGGSFKYLNYQICDEIKPGCQEKGLKLTPSWEYNGTILHGYQTLETISELTGCPLG